MMASKKVWNLQKHLDHMSHVGRKAVLLHTVGEGFDQPVHLHETLWTFGFPKSKIDVYGQSEKTHRLICSHPVWITWKTGCLATQLIKKINIQLLCQEGAEYSGTWPKDDLSTQVLILTLVPISTKNLKNITWLACLCDLPISSEQREHLRFFIFCTNYLKPRHHSFTIETDRFCQISGVSALDDTYL